MHKWVDVKDRLPPRDDQDEGYSIFVLVSDGKNIGLGYHSYEYFSDDPHEEIQYSSDYWVDLASHLNTCISGFAEVTHWMELPEPPED